MKKHLSLNLLGFAMALLLLYSALVGYPQPGLAAAAEAAPGGQIKIDNFSFTPPTLAVPVRTTVTWTNHDDIPHNIVSSEQKFKSKPLDTDDAYSFTFTEPGTYEYFCGLHPKMVGKVVVETGK